MRESVTIVGPGRVGQALGKLLHRARVDVRYVAGRDLGKARKAAQFIGSGEGVLLSDARLAEPKVLLVTSGDAALGNLSSALVRLRTDWHGKVVLHTSGSIPASVLSPFRERRAAIGSMHPFQTVPDAAAGAKSLVDCFWGIEGDTQAVEISTRWVKALGGVPFRIDPLRKTLYHASAFLACAGVVTLLSESAALLKLAGVPAEIAEPMLVQFAAETLTNFAERGAQSALTGPVSRGDWDVVRKHLDALAHHHPEAVPVYKDLLLSMARLAKRSLPEDLSGNHQ